MSHLLKGASPSIQVGRFTNTSNKVRIVSQRKAIIKQGGGIRRENCNFSIISQRYRHTSVNNKRILVTYLFVVQASACATEVVEKLLKIFHSRSNGRGRFVGSMMRGETFLVVTDISFCSSSSRRITSFRRLSTDG